MAYDYKRMDALARRRKRLLDDAKSVTQDLRTEILAARHEDEPQEAIANHSGLSRVTVQKILKDTGKG